MANKGSGSRIAAGLRTQGRLIVISCEFVCVCAVWPRGPAPTPNVKSNQSVNWDGDLREGME
jgi:hypothetical protein